MSVERDAPPPLSASPGGPAPRLQSQPLATPLHGLALLVAVIRSVATYVVVSLYVLVVGPPGLLIAWAFGWSGVLFVLAHIGVALALALAGIKVRVEHRERLPRGRTAVYMGNHTSNVDAPLMFHYLHPRLRMLYKAEFGKVPILGRGAYIAGFIPVERQHPDQAQQAVEKGAVALAQGRSFMVFPEGTRSRTGEMLPFKKGGFIMAIKAQVPVVPVAMLGGTAAMMKGSWIIHPVSIEVRVGEPIETTGMTFDDRDRLIAITRAQIERMLAGTA